MSKWLVDFQKPRRQKQVFEIRNKDLKQNLEMAEK